MSSVDEDSPPRSGTGPLAKQALDALGDHCRIPADLEEKILSRVLDAAPPVVRVEEPRPAPFGNVIRLGRAEERRFRWAGPAAAFAALAVAATVVLSSRPAPHRGVAARPSAVQMRGVAPGGFRGYAVPDEHPRLVEARHVLFVVARKVDGACRAGAWSAVVLFEHSGDANVLDVTCRDAEETACVGDALAGARIRPTADRRLVVLLQHEAGADLRARGWLVDET